MKIVLPPLGPELLDDSPAAGELFVQGHCRDGKMADHFNAIVGYGLVIVADAALKTTLALLLADAAPTRVNLVLA